MKILGIVAGIATLYAAAVGIAAAAAVVLFTIGPWGAIVVALGWWLYWGE